MKKAIAVLCIAVICSVFCACSTGDTLEKTAFVKTVAIDKDENGLLFGVQTLVPKSEEEENVNYFSNAKSITEGFYEIDSICPERLFYGQTELIIVGQSYAESGIEDALNYFTKNNDFRLDIPVLVVKDGSAGNVMNSTEKLSEKMKNFFLADKNAEISGEITIAEYLKNSYLPYISFNDDISVRGYAFFKGDKLISFNDEDVSNGINLINNKIKKQIVNLQNGIVVRLKQTNSKIDFTDKFNIQIELQFEILENPKKVKKDDVRAVLEKSICEKIENSVSKLKKDKCDCCGFNNIILKNTNKKEEFFEKNFEVEIFSRLNFSNSD